jgi:hypothetical protein
MALSDQLSRLAVRAKEAETRAGSARTKAKTDLERDVASARASSQAEAERLRATADAQKDEISSWWNDAQGTWNENIASIRDHIDEKRAEHDLASAERRADSSEQDALFAIDFAYSATEEAEYAVLDAILARMEADELSVPSGSTA